MSQPYCRVLYLGSIGLVAGVFTASPIMADLGDLLRTPDFAFTRNGDSGDGGKGGGGGGEKHGGADPSDAAAAERQSGAAINTSDPSGEHRDGSGADATVDRRQVPPSTVARILLPTPAGAGPYAAASDETVDRVISSVNAGRAAHPTAAPPSLAEAASAPLAGPAPDGEDMANHETTSNEMAGGEVVDRVIAGINARGQGATDGAGRPKHRSKGQARMAAHKSTPRTADRGQLDRLVARVFNDLAVEGPAEERRPRREGSRR